MSSSVDSTCASTDGLDAVLRFTRRVLRTLLLGVFLLGATAGTALVGCAAEPAGDPLLEDARHAFGAGDYAAAEEFYEAYLREHDESPYRWEAQNRLVDIALAVRRDYPRAAARLDAMHLEYGDDEARAHDLLIRLAEVYEAMEQPAKALETWRRVLKGPTLSQAEAAAIHASIGDNHAAMKNHAAAAEAYAVCVADAPTAMLQIQCRYTFAQAVARAGRAQEAVVALREIMRDDAADAEMKAVAGFLLAELLVDAGETEEARRLFEQIRADYPNPYVVDRRLNRLQR